jgi:hypothetical protein
MPSIEEAMDISQQKSPEYCAEFYLERGAGCCVCSLWVARGHSMPTELAEELGLPPMMFRLLTQLVAGMLSTPGLCVRFITKWT